MAPNPQATIALHPTGQKMSLVGFGLWKVTKSETATTIYNAIKAGYRLFDGACDYGNEKEAGEGIRKAIKDRFIKREDVFVTTKLWNTFHKREHVRPAAERQNEEYGSGYIDLYLVHMPIPAKYVDPVERYPPGWSIDGKSAKVVTEPVSIQETWQAMEELVDAGNVKNIGVSNFQDKRALDILLS